MEPEIFLVQPEHLSADVVACVVVHVRGNVYRAVVHPAPLESRWNYPVAIHVFEPGTANPWRRRARGVWIVAASGETLALAEQLGGLLDAADQKALVDGVAYGMKCHFEQLRKGAN